MRNAARLTLAPASGDESAPRQAPELRLPVVVFQQLLQRARLAEELDWPSIAHELAQLRTQIDALLDIARAQPIEQRRPEPFDFVAIVRHAVALAHPLATELGREVVVAAPDHLAMTGHRQELGDAMRLLIESVLAAGAGTLRVLVNAGPDRAVVELTDAGAGLSESARTRISQAMSRHRAAVSFIAEPAGDRVRVSLPCRTSH